MSLLWTLVSKEDPLVRTTRVAVDICRTCGPEIQRTGTPPPTHASKVIKAKTREGSALCEEQSGLG